MPFVLPFCIQGLAECLAKSVSCCHYEKTICSGADGAHRTIRLLLDIIDIFLLLSGLCIPVCITQGIPSTAPLRRAKTIYVDRELVLAIVRHIEIDVASSLWRTKASFLFMIQPQEVSRKGAMRPLATGIDVAVQVVARMRRRQSMSAWETSEPRCR
jgi:hypothetical protein